MIVTPHNKPVDEGVRLSVRRSTGRLLGFCLAASFILHLGVIVYSQTTAYTPIAKPRSTGINIELLQDKGADMQQAATRAQAQAKPAEHIQAVRNRNSRKPATTPMQSVSETPPDSRLAVTESATPAKPAAASAKQAIGINDLLQAAVHHALQPHFKYPILARRRGWEGTVRVSVRVESDGELSRLHLVGSSRYGVLDKAAMKSLQQVTRIPAAAAWLGGQHYDMVLPVEYRLLDS